MVYLTLNYLYLSDSVQISIKYHTDPDILSLLLSSECKQNYREKAHSFWLNQSMNCRKQWISGAPPNKLRDMTLPLGLSPPFLWVLQTPLVTCIHLAERLWFGPVRTPVHSSIGWMEVTRWSWHLWIISMWTVDLTWHGRWSCRYAKILTQHRGSFDQLEETRQAGESMHSAIQVTRSFN